jgi:hypothetical protein
LIVKHNLFFASRLGRAPDVFVHLVYKLFLLLFGKEVFPEEDTWKGEG